MTTEGLKEPSYHKTVEEPFDVDSAANSLIAEMSSGGFDQFESVKDIPENYDFEVGEDGEIKLPPAGDISEHVNPKPKATEPAAETIAPASSVEEVAKEDPAVARGFEKLIEKETTLAVREREISAREVQYRQLEQEVQQYRTQNVQVDEFRSGLTTSPTEALKKLGLDANVITPLLIAERLQAAGSPVPPELQRQIADAKRDSESKALREEVANFKREQAETQYWGNVYQNNAVELRNPEFGKTAPLVKKLFVKDPMKALELVHNEIRQDAKTRLENGESGNGRLITAEEAAKRIQERYAIWASLNESSPGNAGTPPAASTKVPNTNEGGGTENRGVVAPKPKVARPLKPWQKQEDIDLDEAGILAGIAAARDADVRARRA
jgi:hypothetical protein